MKKIILVGPPGAGKGTLAGKLSVKYHIPHISTGGMLRREMEKKTELGLTIADRMAKGELMTNEEMVPLLESSLNDKSVANGFLLDGFPRTVDQIEITDRVVDDITAVIYIHVSDEEIIRRMGGRRTCSQCGAIFHMTKLPPKVEGICDKCGGDLYVRHEDAPEVVLDRIRIYKETTAPVVDHYRQTDKFLEVDGSADIDATVAYVDSIIEAKIKGVS